MAVDRVHRQQQHHQLEQHDRHGDSLNFADVAGLAANAEATEAALNGAGVGPARHGETLWLQGDAPGGTGKDERRAAISERYCVIAMAGDQLGDFSDLFNARALSVPDRRRAASSGRFAELWGNGWFLLSNPVYGPVNRGGFDDVFPADRCWSDHQGDH